VSASEARLTTLRLFWQFGCKSLQDCNLPLLVGHGIGGASYQGLFLLNIEAFRPLSEVVPALSQQNKIFISDQTINSTL